MRIGLSSDAYAFTDENFSSLVKCGITDMELSLPTEEYSDCDYNMVRRLADKH